MTEKAELTVPELSRALAWLESMEDALFYLALAKQKEDFVRSEAFVYRYSKSQSKVIRPQRRVGHIVETGLVSAAIVSAGKLFKNADGDGDNIATNPTHNNGSSLDKLRKLLFECSDLANNWEKGRSDYIYAEKVQKLRDHFVSHNAGSEMKIQLAENGVDIESQIPANPWFCANSFDDLERVLYEMHQSLGRYVKNQSTALKEERADVHRHVADQPKHAPT